MGFRSAGPPFTAPALEALRESATFGRLEDSDLAALAPIAEERLVERNTRLFDHGDEATHLWLVVEGLVRIFREAPSGGERILHLVGPPGVFAEAAIFEERDYPASAATVEESHLVLFPREPFLRELAARPRLALGMLAGQSAWLRRMVSRVEELTLAEAPQRLARYLLDLRLERESARLFVTLPARKYLVASQLGMTAPTFSRALAKLESDALIRVEGARLELLDTHRLEELGG